MIVDKPSVCQRGLPSRLSSHCSSIQHGRPTALTSSLVALPASLGLLRPVSRTARGLRAPRRRRPSVPALRTSCARASSRFAASNGSDRDGNAFLPTVRNRRSTSHAKRACGSCCSLGLLRPVSATGGGLRAHPQFAMVVLLRLTACSTPLLIGLTSACFAHCARPSCAPQKMPEMTYTPSFLI